MRLILFRHAIAIEREDAVVKGIEDSKRPLTPKGKEKARGLLKAMKKFEPQMDFVVSSPFLRALQTAELICQNYGLKEIHQSAELVPSAPPQAFALWLQAQAGSARQVIAVGHEPHLSHFCTWLLAGSVDNFVDLKKAGAIGLEIESFEEVGPKSAILKWMIQPKLFSE